MTTLNLQCDESADDGYEVVSSGNVNITSNAVLVGNFSIPEHWAVRFPSVSGLSGSAITSAILTFRAARTDSGSFVADWFADDRAAPTVLVAGSGSFDISTRTRTTATCEADGTDFGDWTINEDQTFTGDGTNTIADIIQELADSFDPSVIMLIGIYSSGTGERVIKAYDASPSTAPKLDLIFSAGGGSTQTATPSPVVIPIVVPALSPVMYPAPVVMPIAIPLPAVTGGTTIFPEPVVIPIATAAPTITAGAATLTPSPVAIPVAIPAPVISSAGANEVFVSWGLIERFIDPAEFAPSTTFFLEMGMFTSSAAVPVKARLFNITDGLVVSGSEATTTATSYTVVRSSSFSLSSGLKKYRIEYGGQQGGIFFCHGGDVKPEGS